MEEKPPSNPRKHEQLYITIIMWMLLVFIISIYIPVWGPWIQVGLMLVVVIHPDITVVGFLQPQVRETLEITKTPERTLRRNIMILALAMIAFWVLVFKLPLPFL